MLTVPALTRSYLPMKPVTASYKEAESSPDAFDTPPDTLNDLKEREINLTGTNPQGNLAKKQKTEAHFVIPTPTIFPAPQNAHFSVHSETKCTMPENEEHICTESAVPMDTSQPQASREEPMSLPVTRQTVSTKQLSLMRDIRLRGYQEELAGPGLEGKNYIFVAPTGTGKTLVAGYIIMHHLNKMLQEGRKGTVAFVTPTRQLTFQQKTQLQEYIPGIRAVEITGASIQPMLPLVHSDEVDVIVCTAGKLRRELKVKAVKIGNFSLIVADECHHAGRPSNYSDIMEFYIRFKLTEPVSAEPSLSLPQVVGLTASPGAGRGKSNISTVIEHHISLCATMDATAGIVTVGKNTAELERVRNATKSYLEVKDERDPSDPFILHICSAMKRYIGNIPCLAQGSSKKPSAACMTRRTTTSQMSRTISLNPTEYTVAHLTAGANGE